MPPVVLGSPAAMPGHHAGRIPPNKGRRCPADPPSVDEIVAVMRQAGDGRHGRRMRGLIVVLWRAGLRIHEALTLTETDLNERRGSLLIRHGKRDRRREVGMDPWAWSVLNSCTANRASLPTGPLFCVIEGPTRGRAWSATAVRAELGHLAAQAGVRIPLPLIQRQLGHAYRSTTGTYLEGISSEEIIGAVYRRRAPTMHASAGGVMFGCGFGEAQRGVESLIRAGQHVPATS